jgi:hypothetical protein
MDEHPHHEPGSNIPSSVSGIVGGLAKVVTKVLKKRGIRGPDDFLNNWQDIVADKVSILIDKVKKQETQPTSQGAQDVGQAEQELGATLSAHPKEAVEILASVYLGPAGVVSSEERRKIILEYYAEVLNLVCTYMQNAKTSVALKGFLNGSDIISYWHLEGQKPHFAMSGERLWSNGLEVYLLFEEPTEGRLRELNEEISRNDRRHLNRSRFDFMTDDTVAKLTGIYETKLELQRLALDRDSRPAGPHFEGVIFGPDYTKPVAHVSEIPTGAPSLPGMIESLYFADKIQNAHFEGLKEAAKRAAEKKDKAS